MRARPRPHSQDPAGSPDERLQTVLAPAAPLPLPIASLVGRTDDVERVVDTLCREEVRLVTLTGPGGVGKSRLALAAGPALQPYFADGVRLVRLAAVHDANLVLAAVASTLGLEDISGRAALETLQATLHDRELLLILDNFEQVVTAGADLADLLRACPRLKALVTSRSRLRVRGEHVFPVMPLAFPDGEEPLAMNALLTFPALELFVQRAREVRPDLVQTNRDLQAVAGICQRLDGLPLAIELAAARSDILPPPALLERLRLRLPLLVGGATDLPDRLRTMRDAIAWSYDLLNDDEKRVFRRLAVFSAGFTAEAVAAIVELPDEFTALDVLGSLADKSLIQRRVDLAQEVAMEPRYGMLETIREFALDELAEAGEEQHTREAHAAWFLRLAERAYLPIYDTADTAWLDKLQRDHDNLRAALAWYRDTGDVAHFLRLASRLAYFWYYRGHLSEGRRWLDEAMRDLPDTIAPHPRAWALTAGALLANVSGEAEQAADMLLESFRWWEQTDDRIGEAIARTLLGGVRVSQGRYREAAPLFEATLAFLPTVDHQPWTANALLHLGMIAYVNEDERQARVRLEEAVAQYIARGSRLDAVDALRFLGLLSCSSGDLDDAARRFSDALDLLRQRGSRAALAVGLADAATYAAWRKAWRTSARLFARAESLLQMEGGAFLAPARGAYEQAQQRTRAALGDVSYEVAAAEGLLLTLEQALAEAEALLALPFVPSEESTSVTNASASSTFTERELDVLRLLVSGQSNPEIAEALYIGRGTVRTHVSNILGKMGAKTRTEAAAQARERGFI